MAGMAANNHDYDTARSKYLQVIRENPGTPDEKEARQKLNELAAQGN
jgi:hypothetical protein